MRRPAVSEVVAALILMVVAVSVGVVVVYWASAFSANALGGLSSALNRGRFSLSQYPVIEYVYAAPGNLTVFVSNEGTSPAVVDAVIVSNSSYVQTFNEFLIQPPGGGPGSLESSLNLAPDQVARIYVNAPLEPGGVYQVKVATASGLSASAVVAVP